MSDTVSSRNVSGGVDQAHTRAHERSKKLLFICSRNQWRSPTAEDLFRGNADYEARSVGTSDSARTRVGLRRWSRGGTGALGRANGLSPTRRPASAASRIAVRYFGSVHAATSLATSAPATATISAPCDLMLKVRSTDAINLVPGCVAKERRKERREDGRHVVDGLAAQAAFEQLGDHAIDVLLAGSRPASVTEAGLEVALEDLLLRQPRARLVRRGVVVHERLAALLEGPCRSWRRQSRGARLAALVRRRARSS